MPDIVNALTVDVEDYFQVSAFEPVIARSQWPAWECRVERNVERLLELFAAHGVRATFFFLGWVAERYPGLVRQAVAAGHEIASHGYAHVQVTTQEPDAFRADVSRTRALLEDLAGVPVVGYRAASYSIAADNDWAHALLAETGHRYSSSCYPIHHDRYGRPDGERRPHRVGPAGLPEIPVATLQLGSVRLPCGGGGWFRLLPYAASRWCLRRLNREEGMPAVFYFHPWEIDPGQPRVGGLDARSRFRHYVNLRGFERKIERLLQDFRWAPVREVFAELLEAATGPASPDRGAKAWASG